jgi:hypothetical protein
MNILSWNIVYNENSKFLYFGPFKLPYLSDEDKLLASIINIIYKYKDKNTIISLQNVKLNLVKKIQDNFKDKTGFSQYYVDDNYMVLLAPSNYKLDINENNKFFSISNNEYRITIILNELNNFTYNEILDYLILLPTDLQNIVTCNIGLNQKILDNTIGFRYIIPSNNSENQLNNILIDREKIKNFKINFYNHNNISNNEIIKITF